MTTCPVCGGGLPCAKHPEEELTATGDARERLVPDTVRRRLDQQEELEQTSKRDKLLGAKVGDYVVVRRLGEGGMGVVYEGLQPLLERRVAIKFLRPEIAGTHDQIDGLLSEARAANVASHRGLIDVFGFGELPGHGAYLVMEYLEGRALDELVNLGPLPPLEVLRLLDETLAALGAAHSRGVIHRDLKPSNVFLVAEHGGGSYVKVLDFGLAKRSATPYGTTPQTRSSVMVGTPEYMAPEQAMGKPVGPKTDLYALGVMAFEMLTGQLPFPGGSVLEVAMHHVNTPAQPPSRLDRSIPPGLDALVLSLLAKDPADRPDSAETVRARLKALTRELMAAQTHVGKLTPAPPPDETGLPQRELETDKVRRPGRWFAAGLVACVVVGVGLFLALRPAATNVSLVPDPPTPVDLVAPPPPPIDLAPEPSGTARLEVTVDANWAEVLLDGTKIGRVPVPGGPFVVPSGAHTLELVNPARKPFRQSLDLKPGQVLKIQGHLE